MLVSGGQGFRRSEATYGVSRIARVLRSSRVRLCSLLRASNRAFVLRLFCVFERGIKKKKKKISSHSFRIGAATVAARNGVPDHLIQALGRWSSNAYQSYIRTPSETLASLSPHLVASSFSS